MGHFRHVRRHVFWRPRRGHGWRIGSAGNGDNLMPDWLYAAALGLIGQAFTAGAIYGAIKGDIKGAIKDAATAKDCAKEAKGDASEAHKRIDKLLMKG